MFMDISNGMNHELGIMPKKNLGQNFLKNKKILAEIARAAELSKKDTVLEVGPGHGELTEFLAERAGKVIAVEKDRDLIEPLKEKFKAKKNVKIIEGDILKIHNSKFIIHNSEFKIVANLPYYIASHFLRKFLPQPQARFRARASMMVLMVQYEVAKRICASPPDTNPVRSGLASNGMNLLALSVQAYGKPKFIKKVSRGNFSPAPNVDSAIVKISEISDNFFKKNKINQKKFFEMLRAAFQQKRKMLRRLLKSHFNNNLPSLYQKKRPEELSLEDWKNLYQLYR